MDTVGLWTAHNWELNWGLVMLVEITPWKLLETTYIGSIVKDILCMLRILNHDLKCLVDKILAEDVT